MYGYCRAEEAESGRLEEVSDSITQSGRSIRKRRPHQGRLFRFEKTVAGNNVYGSVIPVDQDNTANG